MTAPPRLLATGIENSYPTIHNGRLRVDELDKCGHHKHSRTGFNLLEDPNLHTLRYGLPSIGPGLDRGVIVESLPISPLARWSCEKVKSNG